MDNTIEDTSLIVDTMKKQRTQLETRIETLRNTQLGLLSTLQTLIPDVVSSLDLSLQIVSSFNNKPFTPIPPLPSLPPEITKKSLEDFPKNTLPTPPLSTRKPETPFVGEEGIGKLSPLSVVRAMVAQCLLQRVPFDPIDSSTVLRKLENDQDATPAEKAALGEVGGDAGPISAVEAALRAIAEENRGGVELEEFVVSGKCGLMVLSIDRNRLVRELPESRQLEPVDRSGGGFGNGGFGAVLRPPLMPREEIWGAAGAGEMWPRGGMVRGGIVVGPRGILPPPAVGPGGGGMPPLLPKMRTEEDDMKDLEALLNKKSFREMQKSKTGEELLDLIHRPTARETAVAAKFKTKGGSQLKEYCSALTKEDCRRQSGSFIACEKVHFRRIIAPHTDVSQGDCSFLDTCRHMKTCKYVHYELDSTPDIPSVMMGGTALPPPKPLKSQRAEYCSEVELGEPQWINCDIRTFKMEILGQFGVIMADPPWDIHMELPYGTMADDEMRNLNVPVLQTDGLIFLWVTGRAMELGRECLELWGYKRVEEIIWVKTNQLQRIIRTGRTGHWLNHSKEHCLVGIKGNPEVNRNIDTDVIVAEVRETSRKPDEMYPMLERISPRTRKLELFARMHNTHAGWMSLGNQLDGVRLVDDGLRARFKATYPDVTVQPPSPPRASPMEVDSSTSQMRSPFAPTEQKSAVAQFSDHAAYGSEGKQPMAVDTEMAG